MREILKRPDEPEIGLHDIWEGMLARAFEEGEKNRFRKIETVDGKRVVYIKKDGKWVIEDQNGRN